VCWNADYLCNFFLLIESLLGTMPLIYERIRKGKGFFCLLKGKHKKDGKRNSFKCIYICIFCSPLLRIIKSFIKHNFERKLTPQLKLWSTLLCVWDWDCRVRK